MIVIIFCKIQILRKKLVVFQVKARTLLSAFFIYQNLTPASRNIKKMNALTLRISIHKTNQLLFSKNTYECLCF